jgi:hypothetical protein
MKENKKMNVEHINFKPVKAEDMEHYSKFFGLRANRTCDSVGLESFIWKKYYNVRAAIAKRDDKEVGLLWLMGDDDRPFSAMPMCKEEDLEYCIYLMVEYSNKVLKRTFKIRLADEEGIKALNLPKDKFKVEENDDAKDYLYDAEALRTLSGKKLHKKKNHYNSFIKNYAGRYEYRNLSCGSRDEVFKFLDSWRLAKGEDVEKHLDPEVEGIHDVLKHCSKLNIMMSGVFIDGNMEGFTIGSLNTRENMAVIHIEKANPDIQGIYQFINKEFLVNEFPQVALVNREDDLGIEGLRKAKESYHPIDYARKYYVEQLDFKE